MHEKAPCNRKKWLRVTSAIRRWITGHKSADVHQGYTTIERETLARAVEKLPTV